MAYHEHMQLEPIGADGLSLSKIVIKCLSALTAMTLAQLTSLHLFDFQIIYISEDLAQYIQIYIKLSYSLKTIAILNMFLNNCFDSKL